MILALGAFAAVAVALGALTTVAPLVAGAVTAAVILVAFASTVRQGVQMLALGGVAIIAVSYTQATQDAVPSSAKSLSDAVLLIGVLLLVRLRGRLTPRQLRAASVVLLLMAVSAGAGVLGGGSLRLSLLGNWQDARWLGAVGIALAIADALKPSQRRRWAFRWLLLINALNVLVSLYQTQAHQYTGTRLGIPEVTGLFGHPTAGALAATLLLIFVLTERHAKPPSMTRREMHVAVAIGLLGLVLSTRFKPALAVAAVAAFLYLRQVGVRPLALALLAAATPIAITFVLTWATAPARALSRGEATASIIAHAVPRAQFLNGAEQLASKEFPLGEGSGTYGSDLSAGRELVAFNDAGLSGQYGFRTGGPQFNSDNFVAHVLGERGYAGLAAWLLSLVALTYFALVSTPSLFPASVAIAAASLTPVVPVFRDGTSILLFFIPATLCLCGLIKTGPEQQTSRPGIPRPLGT